MATIPGPPPGDNILIGGDFADEIFGGDGNDIVMGEDGDDSLAGNRGRDILVGGDDDDQLDGGKGNDTLFGGNGQDTLIGGIGHDRLSGGEGQDTFVFGGNSGKDKILDFDIESDIVRIGKSDKIQDVDDVIHRAKARGDDVVINLGHGNKIVLKGVDFDEFKAGPEDHIDVI